MISGVTSSAVTAINHGLQQLDRSAQTVAHGGAGDLGQLTDALVAGQQAKLQVAAGAKLLSTANDMLGTILDTFA